MDYAEAREAFFAPRDGAVAPLAWSTPARRLRDAVEPVATICFWSEPAYEAWVARGLDFLQGYVWGRACVLGEPEPGVAAAAFGVFEPGLVADLYASGRAACSLQDVRQARLEGAVRALEQTVGRPEELAATVATLRRAVGAADRTGRPLFAGAAGLPWPQDELAALFHVCVLLREHRGDSHLAAAVAAGLDGVGANVLTEAWVGWDPLTYTASRAWSPEAMQAGVDRLTARGLLHEGRLTEAGRELREQLEATTDAACAPVVDALGTELDAVVELLGTWSARVVERGWFPPDPYKRASG